MTISEAAEKYGISVQAVYKRLKSAGIPVETIKDKKNGNLTEAGEAWIKQAYEKTADEKQPSTNRLVESLEEQIKQVKIEAAGKIKEAQAKTAAERQANEILSVKLEAATQRAEALAADKARLEAQVDKLLESITSLTQPKLTEGQGQNKTESKPEKGRGFWGLFHK